MSSMRSVVLPSEERLEILLDRRADQVGALGERGAAVAVEAVLIGGDLDDRKARAGGLGLDYGDVLDLGGRHSLGGLDGAGARLRAPADVASLRIWRRVISDKL